MQKKRENLKKIQNKRRNLQEAYIDDTEFTVSRMKKSQRSVKIKKSFRDKTPVYAYTDKRFYNWETIRMKNPHYQDMLCAARLTAAVLAAVCLRQPIGGHLHRSCHWMQRW